MKSAQHKGGLSVSSEVLHGEHYLQAMRRSSVRPCFVRSLGPLLLLCLLLPFVFQSLSAPTTLPSSYIQGPATDLQCTQPGGAPTLDADKFCVGTCQPDCFPRVPVCFHSSKVVICKARGSPQYEAPYSHSVSDRGELAVPSIMRFYGERLTLHVEHEVCEERDWIRGLTMVADQRFLPLNKPNPHHEAEKIIPALLMSTRYSGRRKNISLYWFSSEKETSDWTKGFLAANDMEKMVRYLELPREREAAVCFEDAVLFSAPTTVRYIPDSETNDWLRSRVLDYCSIPGGNVTWPLRRAVILDRKGPRHLENKHQVEEIIRRKLNIDVVQREIGGGSFCHQVKAVAEDDFFIVPHGSQNVNLLFARPGAIVIEVFPYLFYSTALRNYTHGAGLHLYSLLGSMPSRNAWMWLFSFLGWDTCFYHVRSCKNYSRKQPIYADLAELETLLRKIRQRGSTPFPAG